MIIWKIVEAESGVREFFFNALGTPSLLVC